MREGVQTSVKGCNERGGTDILIKWFEIATRHAMRHLLSGVSEL